MNEREEAVATALREVWHRHRNHALSDLEEMLRAIRAWNDGTRDDELADEIRIRSHRICGSLTMVGRDEGVDVLRSIETLALEGRGPYATEVVERVHDLLERLRTAD